MTFGKDQHDYLCYLLNIEVKMQKVSVNTLAQSIDYVWDIYDFMKCFLLLYSKTNFLSIPTVKVLY